MSVIRPSLAGRNSDFAPKCAAALSKWEDLEDPADIEEAVITFIPNEQPMRDEVIETLAKVTLFSSSSPYPRCLHPPNLLVA